MIGIPEATAGRKRIKKITFLMMLLKPLFSPGWTILLIKKRYVRIRPERPRIAPTITFKTSL